MKTEKILTADEFCEISGVGNWSGGWEDTEQYDRVKKVMVDFAKYHGEKIMGVASQLAKDEHYNCENGHRIYDNYQILNCYPLENIK